MCLSGGGGSDITFASNWPKTQFDPLKSKSRPMSGQEIPIIMLTKPGFTWGKKIREQYTLATLSDVTL